MLKQSPSHHSSDAAATLVHLLRGRAISQPEQWAYSFLQDGEDKELRISYGQLDRQARAIAIQLQARASSGERALLLYPPGLEYLTAFFGCLYAGLIPVPAYPPRLNHNFLRLQALVTDAQATLALTTQTLFSRFTTQFSRHPILQTLHWLPTSHQEVSNSKWEEQEMDGWQEPSLSGTDLAFLQYTSGSTGQPKGVMVTHANLLHNLAHIQQKFEHTPNSLGVSWLPPYHDMGLIGAILQPLFVGFPCVLMSPTAFLERPLRWLQAISRYQATTSGGPNFAYEYCLRKIPAEQRVGLDLHHWSVAFTGAEPIHQETLEAFATAFAPCGFRPTAWYPCYGLAEATLMVSGGKRGCQLTVCTVEATGLEQHQVRTIALNQSLTSDQAVAGSHEQHQVHTIATDQCTTRTLISCGLSLSDQYIKIVNPETFRECQPNEVGEIWLTGPSVAQGYWNQPVETENSFRAFIAETGAGPFLRTGDLGFLQDGHLFVTGRLKDLLIIRGRNHYPQDIEATVGASHSALRPGSGAAFSLEQGQEERLVVVQEVQRQARTLNQQELASVMDAIRAAVSQHHELQVHSIVLIKPGSLPKTSSGKIQRQACRAAFLASSLNVLASSTLASDATVKDEGREEKTAQLSRPQLLATSAEKRCLLLADFLRQLIAEELHLAPDQIKPELPINTLGLDSLTATHLSAQLEATLGISVPLTSFLQGLSLAQLCAQVLEGLTTSDCASSQHIKPSIHQSGTEYHSLSFAQERFWFLDQLKPGNPAYTIAGAVHLSGPLDVAALEQSWHDLVQRHEVLRTTFVINDGHPIQIIAPAPSSSLAIVDLETGPEGAEDDSITAVRKVINAEIERPFDLARGPLWRATLWHVKPEENVLLLTLHHSIADGWSLGVLVRELGILYQAHVERHPSPLSLLPVLPFKYADFARWQRDWLQGEVRTRELAYWQQQLIGAPAMLDLLTDHPRPAQQTFKGAVYRLMLPLSLTKALKTLSQREGVTLFMTLLAAFQVLLSRYSRQENLAVGTPVANRTSIELEGMIGCFINLLALRTDLTGNPTFQELLQRVHEVALAAYAHQNVPFEQVVEAVQPRHDLSYTPLFQVLFVLQNMPLPALELVGVSSHLLEIESNSTQFDLTLCLEETEEGLQGYLQYNTDLFEETTIARMATHWNILLQEIVTDPNRRLWEYSLLSERERQQLLVEWNATQAVYPHEAVIHELFEAQVERSPNALAVVCADQQLTYRELNTCANQLAHYLHRQGVGPGILVSLCMERSLDLMVGLLGILKAGGAYVPLDPTYPRERLAFLIEDSQAPFLLTQERLAMQLFDTPVQFGNSRVICLDRLAEVISQESAENIQMQVKPEHLAYVIYTSGSTGRPKGVLVNHRNLVHSTTARISYYSEPVKSYLLLSSFAFDSSVAGIFWTLCQGGGTLYLPQDHVQQNPQRVVELIAHHQLSHLLCVPSFYTYLLASATPEQLSSLQVVIVAGEACLGTLVSAHQALLPRTALYNEYGPTEATVWATVANCLSYSSSRSVPIGRPIANTAIYILDQQQQPVPIGVSGEIYIGGLGVTQGYLRRPDLTAERFVPHPFSSEVGARLYRTGDLARYQADGMIEFLGRLDQQVKIRGFRIELGEIEALLGLHPAIREAAVLAREDTPGDKRLVAYVVLHPELPAPESPDLRHFLQTSLPDYMIPANFVVLEALPLTPTEKVDRRALSISENQCSAKLEGAGEYIAPVTELEQQIAQVWQAVLRVEQVGLQDNFFDLGGHSLLLIQVQQQLCTRLQREISLVDLFTYPTVSALAHYLEPTSSLSEGQERIHQRSRRQSDLSENDIAIIGMAGRFPGANTVEEFWANLQAGVESITTFSEEELAAARVAESLRRNPRYVKAGGVLADIDCFDAPFFDYSPREAELMDPQHRLFLEEAWHAMENAGYDPFSYPGSIGVYAGTSISTYLTNNLLATVDTSNMADVYQVLIANDKDFLSTRVSYKLNLRGPSLTVQTACSTSLVAVHLACESLRAGQCDMALAGGVSVGIPLKQGYLYQEGGVISPDGHCRAFDAQAQGMVRGSGLGIVVLKRLADALADGDHIAAVIKGSAINNDGALKVGYTAPSVQGQAQVIEEALAQASVAPETVSYIEAHGTATPLGDPIEVAALTQAFQKKRHVKVLPEGYADDYCGEVSTVSSRNKSSQEQFIARAVGAQFIAPEDIASSTGWCALGSVKSNIGHLDAAAGVAGLLKTVLALQHRQLPPTLHFHQANPQLDLTHSPFRINDELIPWETNGHPRRAGVSSFGIGGTNAHLLLEEAPSPFQLISSQDSLTPVRSWQLLILSAKTKGALEKQTAALATHLGQHLDLCLADIAYTLQVGRQAFSHRRFLVCQENTDAATTLATADPARLFTTSLQKTPSRVVVFLFPGQGSEYVGMGQDLYQSEPTFRGQIDHCADLLKPHLGLDLRQILYPVLYPSMTPQKARHQLSQTWLTQPALFVFEYALAALWLSWGVHPQALLGHDLGEYVAACLAGVLSLEDALVLVVARGRLLQAVSPESPHQTLPLSESRVEPFVQRVAQIRLHRPRQPYLSNVTGTWITAAQAIDPHYWVQQLCQPAHFADNIAELVSKTSWLNGLDAQSAPPIFLEVGPGQRSVPISKYLGLPQEQILASLPHSETEQAESAFLLGTLGKLWLAGVAVDWHGLYPQQRRQRLPLPTYPFEHLHYWVGPPLAPPTLSSDQPSPEKRLDIADWFSLPCWKQALPPQSIPIETLRAHRWCWLVFSDTRGVGNQLVSDLEQAGQVVITVLAGESFSRVGEQTYTINPQQPQDYRTLLTSLATLQLPLPQRIVHLWSVTADDLVQPVVELLETAQTLGFTSLLYLVQALGPEAWSTPMHLWVISNNVQEVTGEERLCPEKATVLGPCKVIGQEYPQITCGSVDIMLPTADPQAIRELSTFLVEEMTPQDAQYHEPTVVYRGKQRWVQTFEPVHLASQAGFTARLREGGVYLITGGLGRIGLVLADYLAQQTQVKLVLVGRSTFPARSDWNRWLTSHAKQDAISQKIRKLQDIEQRGAEVLVCHADVANLEQMQAVIRQTEERFGGLHGVIHAAGIVGEKALCSIAQTGATEQDTQFRPKLQGLLVLAQVIEDKTLDFCLLFSSLSAILGGLGFATYAAANVFMDTFARQQRRTSLTPWSSINWDGWEFQSLPIIPNTQATKQAITAGEGGTAFAQALALSSREPQLIVSTRDLKARLNKWINQTVKSTSVLLQDQSESEKISSFHPRPDLPLAYVPPVSELEQQIAQVWQDVLHIAKVGLQDNFFDLGGHSLLLVQVHQQLCNRLQQDIPLIDLFNYPTVNALAQHLQPATSRPPSLPPTKAALPSLVTQAEQSRETGTNQSFQSLPTISTTYREHDIAIIGMAGRFPGAKTLEEFWANLRDGIESLTFFSDEELVAAGVPERVLQDPHYVKASGVLTDVDCFDATFFGYTPREAELMDPQHRLFLEAAWQALENAGYDPFSYPGSIGVYAGQSQNTYLLTLLAADPTLLDTVGRLQLALGNSTDTLATQVSYKLNLRGPSINVQTACSTSLVAIHQACRSLVAGDCDMALAGGVSVRVPHKEGYLYEEGGMTSPNGHCRSFDAQAQGTVFTSGLGIVVLKRLKDALADGDHIAAVIKGSAINNDGALKVGYTAPSIQGQAEVIEKTLVQAGVALETVCYVEAHGTATPLGDPIEVTALTQAFQAVMEKETSSAIPAGWCALGSVKSNIGHLDAAAGVAGLLKTVLALLHRQLPPTLHFHQANPQLDLAHSPFRVNDELIPWETNGHPRRAGVSSFGIGGTNAHLLLEEAPLDPQPIPNEESLAQMRPWQLIILSAKTKGALEQQTEALATYLHQHSDLCLADVAYTLQVGRHAFSHRRFLVCQDCIDATTALAADPARLFTALVEAPNRSVVFLFPGQGSQYVGMGQDLYQNEPIFRSQIDHCADLLKSHLGLDLRQVLYPALYSGMTSEEASHHLGQTWLTQPVLFVFEYALATLWLSWGIQPQAFLGHSLGEYVAACLAGVFSLEDALALVALRGHLMQQTSPGAMLALPLPESAVVPLLQLHGQELSLAAVNGPQQCVVSGPLEVVLTLARHLDATGVITQRLRTSHAFHSMLVDPMLEPFAQAMKQVHLHPPRLSYLSNVTGTWITAAQATDPLYWVQQLRQPVRFADSIAELVNQSSRLNGQESQNTLPLLLEVGPGQTLSTLARQHPALSREQVLTSLPHPQTRQAESAFLLRTLGKLWLSGVAVDWRGFYLEQRRRRLPLPTYPFERQRYWLAPSPASKAAQTNLKVTAISEPEQNGHGSLHARPDLPSAYEAPSSEVEQRMAVIWRTVLGIDQIGKHDTFFELGGHSVLALQLMAQVRAVFHVDVPLHHLFEAPTIAGLAEAVVRHQHLLQTTSSTPPVTLLPDQPTLVPDKAQRHLPFPLTDVQQAYWLGRSGELELSNVATHGYIEFEVTMLDLERLTQAVRLLIARHEMLRAIILPDGQQQILANVPPYQIKTLDLRNQEPIAVESQLANLRQQLSHQVLPADQWPLFEIRATLHDGQRTRLHVSLDMLIMDAWSIQLLGRELAQLSTNPETPLSPLDLSFRDYVLAEQALRDTESYKRAQTYWRSRLAELPPAPALPLAQSPSALTHPRFVRYSTRLGKASWQHLKDRAAQAALTPSGVLLAAFAQVLATWSSIPRFTLNLTLFNRLPLHPQVNDVIGDFTSLTLLTVDYSAAASFEERARHLQEQLWTDLDHRLMTGVQVLRELAQAQGKPLMPMPVVFTSTLIQDQRDQSEEPAWIGEEVYSISQTPQVWLDHQVIEEAGDLVLNWDVVEALFPAGLIETMFTAYKDLLHRLITTQEVWHLPAHLLVHSLLPTEQLAQRAANNTKTASVSPALLQTLFLEQVAQRPDQPAVISPTQTLSYAELGLRAMQLGKQLRRLGARPNMLVAVVMEKGWEQVVATLGILLAGAAYLPIEPANPAERLAYLLEHGEVQLVLTQSWLLPKLRWPITVTCLSVDSQQGDEEANARIGRNPAGVSPDGELLIGDCGLTIHDMLPVQSPEDLAYVIYTSGSTGLPKGVMIDHRGAVNTILDINQRFQVGLEDRVLALSSLSFDLSVYDIFGTLAAGGTIVLPTAAEQHDPAHWAELLVKEQVTLWNSVPALLELLVDYLGQHPELALSSLRLALLSGDWIPLALPGRVKALAADIKIISLGGATEASIWSICYPITHIKPSWTSIPYGNPLLNQQWHVLTPSLNPCPVWVPGQLYIGGVGLAKGYWRDTAKTVASFITHPHTGERLYRTGDLGRYLPDGNIEFLGREDFQVKVQGYRIELGEIETTLEQHPAVRATAVVAQGEAHGEKRLVAYVVLQEQQPTDQLSLRSFLQGKLPAYMVPTSIVFLDALPLTANGKVDRSQLQARSESSTVSTPSVPALPPARSAMIEQLTRIVSDVLQLEQLDPTMNLLELGASSLEMIRIMNRLEKELHFRPQFSEFYTLPTIQGLGLSYERHQQPQQLAERSEQETKKKTFEILVDLAEREAFKQRQLGLRGGKDGDQGALSLPLRGTVLEEALQERYVRRSSQRRFGTQLLPFTTLSAWLEHLRGVSVEGKPKYLYASAGGLYPVQTYLYSKADRIEGLAAGYYYYHPLANRFIQLSLETQFPRNTYFWINQPVFDEAAFALFFVAQMQAITPIYGEMSRDFCFIEAGLMAQLLEMSAPREQLGLCQIGGLDFEPLRPLFALEESHTFLYSLLGGPPVEATIKQDGKKIDEWEIEDL